jgi:hypothetical protein
MRREREVWSAEPTKVRRTALVRAEETLNTLLVAGAAEHVLLEAYSAECDLRAKGERNIGSGERNYARRLRRQADAIRRRLPGIDHIPACERD